MRSRIQVNEFYFVITFTLILSSLVTEGMGSHIFGFFVYTNVSTLFIYLTILFQAITRTLRFPKMLLFIYAYIIIQTFIINFNGSSIALSFKHFLGLIIFSLSVFSFVTFYKDRIVEIIRIYYNFATFIAIIAISQILLFTLFGRSFVPQNIISGSTTALQSNMFKPEILNIFPRAVGLSSEPSHFAIIILPGVYIALLVLAGKSAEFGVKSKVQAIIVLLGLLFSFSLMGYLGLILSVLFIFANQLKGKLIRKILIGIPFIALMLFSFHSPIGARLVSLNKMIRNIKGFDYSTSNLSAWALVSNLEVTWEGLKMSHFLGTGLNTHTNTYDATIHYLFKSKQIPMELNKADAGSMILRITSEFGMPGIIALILFIFHYKLGKKYTPTAVKTVNTLSLVVLLSYCIRTGSYLDITFMLFLAFYYTTYNLEQNKNVQDDFEKA